MRMESGLSCLDVTSDGGIWKAYTDAENSRLAIALSVRALCSSTGDSQTNGDRRRV
jgi:hypothetical protein